MVKVKKVLLTAILFLLTIATCLSFVACGNETSSDEHNEKTAVGEEGVTPYGLYTDLQFSLDGENGRVYASVKNKFTLFPSTVTVNVELYRSSMYQENVANMTLVASNYIHDLDQGETVTATASTEGRKSFWKAKASYRVDNGSWKENISDTVFLDKKGIKATAPAPEPADKEYFISDFLQTDVSARWLRIDPFYSNIKESVFHPNCVEPVWFNNEYEFNTMKNLFGEIKLDEFDYEDKSFERREQFGFLMLTSPYQISTVFNDGSIALIFIDNEYIDSWNANLFVQYFGKNVSSKYFTATISEEANQALIDLARNIYNSKLG